MTELVVHGYSFGSGGGGLKPHLWSSGLPNINATGPIEIAVIAR